MDLDFFFVPTLPFGVSLIGILSMLSTLLLCLLPVGLLWSEPSSDGVGSSILVNKLERRPVDTEPLRLIGGRTEVSTKEDLGRMPRKLSILRSENLADFWPSHFWPPSSPDCAPLDYGIWGFIESKACATPHPNVDSLKASVEREWAEMPEDYVIKVCRAFRPRVEAMVECDGSHFEK